VSRAWLRLSVHLRALLTSEQLTGYQQKHSVSPRDVMRVLNRAAIPFVLLGPQAIGGWMREPRANQTVDVLVADRHRGRASRLLATLHPRFAIHEQNGCTTLMLRKSHSPRLRVFSPAAPFFLRIFRESRVIEIDYGRKRGRYRIPSLEMALAMAFAVMADEAQPQDEQFYNAHDFICMATRNEEFDEGKLQELGEVAFAGGGRELVEDVRRVHGGGRLGRFCSDPSPHPVPRDAHLM
jgi:hypothetical protein